MEPITSFTAAALALPIENVDTDQIIPARFLKTTDKTGLGESLFADWRYRADGTPDPDFVLNRPEARAAQILVAGPNFGCGSSREHAPWALVGFGFRAVISPSFADIFRSNALKNGLLPVELEADAHARLLAAVEADPSTRVSVDLEAQSVILPDGTRAGFPIDPFAKYCLVQGIDQLGFLLGEDEAITRYEADRPRRVHTLQPAGEAA